MATHNSFRARTRKPTSAGEGPQAAHETPARPPSGGISGPPSQEAIAARAYALVSRPWRSPWRRVGRLATSRGRTRAEGTPADRSVRAASGRTEKIPVGARNQNDGFVNSAGPRPSRSVASSVRSRSIDCTQSTGYCICASNRVGSGSVVDLYRALCCSGKSRRVLGIGRTRGGWLVRHRPACLRPPPTPPESRRGVGREPVCPGESVSSVIPS